MATEATPQPYTCGEELCEYISGQSDGRAVLSFSLGKDAVGSWLQMRRYFREIHPVYFELVPGLSFVEKALTYYEDFFGCHITRVPHPSLYRHLRAELFQPPTRISILDDLELPNYKPSDVTDAMKDDLGLPDSTWSAIGVRAADSIVRYLSVKKHGAHKPKTLEFYPVYDWKKKRLLDELLAAKVKLPVDYKWFGRSFDGIDARFTIPIKENAPEDYQKILKWYPLLELDHLRLEGHL
ncbi:MAG TPA: hypothetical protein VFF76_00390 [Holophagaceae bacterium]|jgi:hypothetical protein|nr:hypothetical protein [Holophagaceae bacterium]